MSTGLPPSFNPTASHDVARRPRLFDPALKQYSSAVRASDPAFARPEDAARWQAARRQAADHVLRAIAESAWGEHLVLRGSRLLKAWLGDEAREPGDLDWVVRPPTARLIDPWTIELFDDLVAAVTAEPGPAGVAFVADAVATDDIWTYERAAGRRLFFPWQTTGLPGGNVQVDVVLGEEIPDPPVLATVPAADGGCVTTWAASREQSLAWKLLWLDTDMYSQGKDLYDAALLAPLASLARSLLAHHLDGGGRDGLPVTATELVGRWGVDWENFVRECPWVTGTETEWRDRLARALEPTFAGSEWPTPVPIVPQTWRSADVMGVARAIDEDRAFGRLPILADALMDAGCDDENILNHCHRNGPHVRACWVVSLILGKD